MKLLTVLIVIVVSVGVTAKTGRLPKASYQANQQTKVASSGAMTKTKSGSIKERESEYVPQDQFDAAIKDITDMQSQMASDLNQLVSGVSDLKNNYEHHTVKQCQSGLITNACDDTACEHNFAEHTVSFSPAFSSTPTVTVGMVAFDDYNGTPVRYDCAVYVDSRSEMIIGFLTWGDSKIPSAKVQWMACA